MIAFLDKTLEELLKRELPHEMISPGATTPVTISFATPDDQFASSSVTLPAVDLFLYDVRENRELRSNEYLVERRTDGSATKRPPSVRIDCSYLITAWARADSGSTAQDEHRLLSEVMKVLLRHPTIPSAVLQGGLVGQEPPLPTSTLQPALLQSLGEFWQALGGKPKAALHYTVTIGLDVHEPIDAGVPVRDKRLRSAIAEREG